MAHALVTARWSDLLLVAWEAPERLLLPHVPPGCEMDRWQGRAYLNLVALRFHRVRVAGLPLLPGFTQLNLRTFVRQGSRGGVAFLRLFVTNPAVSAVMRWRYGQPARTARVTRHSAADARGVTVEYGVRGARLAATGSVATTMPAQQSLEHFCKERYWGFGPVGGRTVRFRVEHPPWAVRPVWRWTATMDFATLLGPEWRALDQATPALVMLATGSAVGVFGPERNDG